jgi:hypothetical protein
MTPDPGRRGDVAVVARADIARLTLRLRAAQREAAEAESAANVDPTAAATLEARLAPLVEQRRDALTAELERVRDEALAAIADARRRADEVLARFAPPVAPAPAVVPDVPVVAVVPPAPVMPADAPAVDVIGLPIDSPANWITPAEGIPVTPAEPVAQPIVADPAIDNVWAPSRPAAAADAAQAVPVPGDVPPLVPAASVLIDAEAFARVFASMIAQVIDERDRRPAPPTQPPVQPIVQPSYVQAPYMQPQAMQQQAMQPQMQPQMMQPQMMQPQMMPVQPAKQGFWATARHLDVMLLGTTMVIALVILAAWLA